MKKVMYSLEEVIELIRKGKNLLLAGDEELLKKLPAGKWIGGTIPYFMASEGGIVTSEKILVEEIPSFAEEVVCKSYDIATIKNVYKEGFDNGFSIIIIPASSDSHLSFAINAPDYKDFATKPLIGWISGVLLDDLGKKTPKTFVGSAESISDKDVAVMHVKIPEDKYAEISILNLFKQGSGDTFEFPETGFSAKEVLVNGIKQNFAEYALKKELDVRLPLVADYNDTMINISFQSIEEKNKQVIFYAPVFKGVKYKQAAPITDYIKEFTSLIPENEVHEITFSCNCILNFLYSNLEGKKTGTVTGPITFGEIAYQLLNQTMVSLEIKDL
jgi:hypothetical protein